MNTNTSFHYNITRYENGEIKDAYAHCEEYPTRERAIEAAQHAADYWKYHYGRKYASVMNTEKGAMLYVELPDGRRLLNYYEVLN